MISLFLPLLASVAFLLPSQSIRVVHQPQHEPDVGLPLNVLPLPTHYSTGNRVICLSPDFTVTFENDLGEHSVPKDLRQAAQRAQDRIWRNKHRYLSVERGAEFFGENGGCKYTLSTLHVIIDHEGTIDTIMDSAIKPAEERPDLEAYTLSVPLGSHATIRSSTSLGAFRGLTTFENLFYHLPMDGEKSGSAGSARQSVLEKPNILGQSDQLPLGSSGQTDQVNEEDISGSRSETEGKWYAPAAPYEIEDKPAFGWRAVLLDTSRNWFSKEAILKVC
jgi:hexosaminidase